MPGQGISATGADLTRRDAVRWLAKSGAAVAFSGALAACGSSDDAADGEVVTIRFAAPGTPEELTRLTDYTRLFMRANPSIRVRAINVPSAEYTAKLTTQIRGRTAPDGFVTFDDSTATFIKANALVDLGERMQRADALVKEDEFVPALLEPARSEDGRLYAAPASCNPIVMWFNRGVLEQAGVKEDPVELYEGGDWTWSTFIDLCRQIKAAGHNAFVSQSGWWAPPYIWVTTNGGKIFDDGRFVLATDPNAVEGLQFMADNIKSGLWGYPRSGGPSPDTLLASNKLAFAALGRWALPTLKDRPDTDCDIVPVPTNTGNRIEPTPMPVGFNAVYSGSEHIDQAVHYVLSSSSADGERAQLKDAGNALPAVKGTDEIVLEDGPAPRHAQYFLDAREVAVSLPAEQARVPAVTQAIVKGLDPIFSTGADVRATLGKVAAAVEEAERTA